MDPGWLSNAYLAWDEGTREAFFVDSGAPLAPLLDVVEREDLNVTTLLTTHTHGDHVAGDSELEQRFGVRGTQSVAWAQALATPGHADDHVAFVVDGICFSGDLLFKDAVGGGPDAEVIRASVLKLLELPDDTRVLPGHTDETTIGRERAENPFMHYWLRGQSLEEPCRVAGDDATLVVWSPDYDGNGKALVRFADGRESIVGGSRVER
jgi:glyoxylase-like metal-dependent hydrolase (beta-lactamase superfamily II)